MDAGTSAKDQTRNDPTPGKERRAVALLLCGNRLAPIDHSWAEPQPSATQATALTASVFDVVRSADEDGSRGR